MFTIYHKLLPNGQFRLRIHVNGKFMDTLYKDINQYFWWRNTLDEPCVEWIDEQHTEN